MFFIIICFLGEIKNKKTGMIKNDIPSVCCGKDTYMNRNTLFSSCLKKKKNTQIILQVGNLDCSMKKFYSILWKKLRVNKWKIISNWPI